MQAFFRPRIFTVAGVRLHDAGMTRPPVIDIDMDAFWRDPYPALDHLRRTAPVAFVPQLDGIVFTRRDDIDVWEKRVDVFSSEQPGGLMTRLMGENMMRRDGVPHQTQRRQIQPSVSPRTVARHWREAFRDAARTILQGLSVRRSADLCTDYAMLLSGEALRLITGLEAVSARDMDAHSQAMIDGIANYGGDPDTEARCLSAVAALDAAINARIADFETTPTDVDTLAGSSMIAVLVRAGAPHEQIRANVKLAISGGQNEPRDAIAGVIWALLSHPDQLALALDGVVGWDRVFEEYVRWMSPIGMSPRRIAADVQVAGVDIKAGGRAFFMFSAANRDPAHFDNPDQFDVQRDTRKHIAFGAGPHFCAGAFAARALVADVALPMIFDRLPSLRLDPDHPAVFRGRAFRGPVTMHARWH